jgi:hypothetical protein
MSTERKLRAAKRQTTASMQALDTTSRHSPKIEREIKLPRARGRKIAALVDEREPDLYDLKKVDVTPQCLIVVVCFAAKRPNWSRHHTRKFRILQQTQAR